MKNFLQNLYKGKEWMHNVNWEFLNSIPEFEKLNHCEQNPKWHSEGNVMEHTKLSIKKFENEVLNLERYNWYNDDERFILRASIILHDIGKGVVTSIGKDGNWHAYEHEIYSEKIARVLLWNENIHIRETICSLVRYHMTPLQIFESKNWIYKMFEIGCRVPLKLLYAVKMADLLGSVQENGGTMDADLKKLDFFKDAAKSLGLWDNVSKDKSSFILKYGSNRNIMPWKISTDKNKVAIVLIGLPGSGKNTFIETILKKEMPDNCVQISRDDIRVKIGICDEGGKCVGSESEEIEVTRISDELLSNAINDGKPIVINNINLKRKYRDAFTKILRNNGYCIKFVYIEAPTIDVNIKRRDGQIPKEAIQSCAYNFDFPEPSEYDELFIEKQTL